MRRETIYLFLIAIVVAGLSYVAIQQQKDIANDPSARARTKTCQSLETVIVTVNGTMLAQVSR